MERKTSTTCRRWTGVFLLGWAFGAAATAQESSIERLQSIPGLAGALEGQRAPDSRSGTLWVVPLAGGVPQRWGQATQARSPAFGPDGSLWALEGETIVHIARPDAEAERHATVPGILKLVGFSSLGELMVLRSDAVHPLAVLVHGDGKPLDLPIDNPAGKALLSAAISSTRGNASVRVLTQLQRTEDIRGPIEWRDIVVRPLDGSPMRKLSDCAGANCEQPALDAEGTRVAYVRSRP